MPESLGYEGRKKSPSWISFAVMEYEEAGNQLTNFKSTGVQLGEGAYLAHKGDWCGRFVEFISNDVLLNRLGLPSGLMGVKEEGGGGGKKEEKQEEKKVQEDAIPSKDEIPPRGIIRKNPRKRLQSGRVENSSPTWSLKTGSELSTKASKENSGQSTKSYLVLLLAAFPGFTVNNCSFLRTMYLKPSTKTGRHGGPGELGITVKCVPNTA
ncbi:hypothetical protein EV361DRAFT_870577 [Lentinula raphanica]|nr:hypothetical protein EV361DRAFT_870577 [Lentinula raphanica]